jgi:hypothetical protein
VDALSYTPRAAPRSGRAETSAPAPRRRLPARQPRRRETMSERRWTEARRPQPQPAPAERVAHTSVGETRDCRERARCAELSAMLHGCYRRRRCEPRAASRCSSGTRTSRTSIVKPPLPRWSSSEVPRRINVVMFAYSSVAGGLSDDSARDCRDCACGSRCAPRRSTVMQQHASLVLTYGAPVSDGTKCAHGPGTWAECLRMSRSGGLRERTAIALPSSWSPVSQVPAGTDRCLLSMAHRALWAFPRDAPACPGNPGSAEFYNVFLDTVFENCTHDLAMDIFCISHAGHCDNKNSGRLFTLDDQSRVFAAARACARPARRPQEAHPARASQAQGPVRQTASARLQHCG